MTLETSKNSQAQLSNDVSHCMSLLQQHSASIVRHDELISNCEASIQQLQSAQASILSNISNVESRLTNALVNDRSLNTNANNIPSSPTETWEIFRRSHNIILKGLPEGNNDSDSVTDIINHIEPSANGYRLNMTRLGAVGTSRPRLIKVGFASPIIAKNILRKKNDILSHSTYNSVKILDDKTPSQMHELQQLREELKRRLTAGERNFTIKYVKGRPSIVNIVAQQSSVSKNC
ncbi:unnamed protein product [Acanthoscelides obtectus]|uniref:Uncharacterized protein n=1 Tax=Acanthoscelides obtectus TaxID=200917 RepID=A0A9P0KNQ0_ACAOB|nr:unnamed protein product [Acanthoscelides obtectus]CAK1631421.1 hypothetical protein AOBTE_LOCUS6942 [Acanthoscelides obtectus]